MSNMLKISEAASLGLHTMALLARQPDRLLSTQEVAETFRASQAHLAKVMHRLAQAELVRAVRGPGGGFALARPPERITLLEVYEAIEGPLQTRDCLYSTAMCSGEHCLFGGLLSSVDRQVRQYLSGMRLSEAARIMGVNLIGSE